MRIRTFRRAYHEGVRAAFKNHLAQLGFSLRKERYGVLAAESARCRVLFDPDHFVPLLQRAGADPNTPAPVYRMEAALEALGHGPELDIGPGSPDELVGHITSVLVERCRPILDGDEAAWRMIEQVAAERDRRFIAKLAEAGVHLRDGDGWRELQGLESVSSAPECRLATGIMAFGMLFISLLFVIVLIPGRNSVYFPTDKPLDLAGVLAAAWMCLLLIALDAWVVKRIRRTQYSWRTSPEALTIGKFLGKQSVPWSSVRSASVFPGPRYELRTTSGSITLDKQALRNPILEASIWQQLNRAGVTDKPILSPLAVSLWALVPEEKVGELHWEHSKQLSCLDVLLRFVAWQMAIWGVLVWTGFRLAIPLFILSVAVLGWAVTVLITVRHIVLNSEGIEASTALGKLHIPWRAVRSMRFVGVEYNCPTMRVRAGFLRSFEIPWLPDQPNSARVILAIIRQLREQERFRLVPFPIDILLAVHGDEEMLR